MLDFLRVAFDPQSNSRFDKRFHDIQNVPYLILDDLSLASATAWAKEKLFQIIDSRYLAKLPTVVTVSETIERLEETFTATWPHGCSTSAFARFTRWRACAAT